MYGDDTVYGGKGDDEVLGGQGVDSVFGHEGGDVVVDQGGSGDFLVGGKAVDTLCSMGVDTLYIGGDYDPTTSDAVNTVYHSIQAQGFPNSTSEASDDHLSGSDCGHGVAWGWFAGVCSYNTNAVPPECAAWVQ